MIIFLLVVIAIPTSTFFILQNSRIQTYLTQKITAEISENLNVNFEVGSVNFRFFNRVVLKNVYIEDQLNDTLLFSKEAICNLKRLDRKNKKIDISKINLINAKIYLHKFDTLQPINIVFSKIDSSKIDTSSAPKDKWDITFQNIEMHQSIFRYKSYRKKVTEKGIINFNNLDCYIDVLDVRNLTIENGVVNFYTKKLKVKEKTGFYAYNVKFNMSIGKQHMIFKNVKIRTPYSYISSDSLVFRHKNYDEYQHFAKNIYLDFTLQESNISFKDIGYFSNIFKDISVNTVFSGRVYSKLSTFKGKDVKFHIGEQTELITDFNLNGLPNHKEMFIYVDFKKLTTWAKDFEVINEFTKGKNKFTIPENFNKLGIISYKGNFAGFYNDFVTYGKFTSDLGNVSTDLSLQPDTSGTLAFSGNLTTSNFNIGELAAGTEKIGKISMDAQINGSTKNKTVNAKTEGVVHNIEINHYNYQNVLIDGYLTEKTYDGFLSISDPNIEFSFRGGIDFSKKIPVFNFKASVPQSNLYGLNIDKKDTTASLSFDVEANFEGIDVDNAVGEISFTNTKLTKLNTELPFDTLRLISEEFADTHRIELNSDYIDALLVGTYKSSTLPQSIRNLYFNYLPALVKNQNDTSTIDFNNNFELDIDLKKTNTLSRFFIPSVYFSDNASLNFSYNASRKRFQINAFSNEFRYNKHTFNDLTLNTFSNDSIFTILTKCNSLLLNNYFKLENFKTTSLTQLNKIDLKINWNNNDTVDYEGQILASTLISQEKPFDNSIFKLTFLPSQVIVKDSLWYINKSQITIDTSSIAFNNFKIDHGNQHFIIEGKASENPNDTLFFDVKNLDLAHLNVITKEKKLEFGGIIEGKANFSRIFNNPLFYADIEIDNLVLNDEEFGHTQLFSRWIEQNKAIQVEASTQHNNQRTVNISGNYYPNDKSIMFNVILDKLGLNVINPYLNGFASKITGTSDGTAMITGTLKQPNFIGSLYMHDAALTIDYIKTRYNFTSEVLIEDNSLIFKNVDAKDTYGNSGLTNGFVKFGPRKEINFNFNIDANNIHALNTTGNDNQSFYGTAFMTGVVNIEGDKENTFLDISARTEKNTKVNIPLTRLQDADQTNFVSFINDKIRNNEVITEYNYDYSGFGLNLDLEVTTDAEALLIFDSKIGDVIRGKGEGNIKMGLDDNTDFNMYGDYTFDEGDYLFTLQNVINKKFKIERGGNIIWNGDPGDANVDIEAIYTVKTSLSSLVDSTTSYYSNEDFKKRIPVQCQVHLSNRLMNPDIGFNLNLPTAGEESKTLVRSAIDTEEKLNKQFLSLLVLNSFMRDQSSENSFASSSTTGLGTVTTSELLSNQLSNWLSQISDEWDIGVNYRPGDEISKDQVEVALSTQLLDDRVSINGNVGYGGQTVDQASNIVGDFNIDVKLNKSGKLRLKAFNESNDKLLYENTPYTQGVGIFYREEFNSFSELLRKFWNKKNKKKVETKNN